MQSRKEAIEKGNNRYLGKPCKNCGNKERYVVSRTCIICIKKNKKLWYKNNPDKIKAKSKRNYLKNPKRLRNNFLKYKYGIDLKGYEQMFELQKGLCAICLKPEKNKSLAVDHNHQTKKIRKLLCEKCNKGLGLFEENMEYLKSAVLYLRKYV